MPAKPDLPEWCRVALIFVMTFSLLAVVAGLFGVQYDKVDSPEMTQDYINRPYAEDPPQ